MHVLRKLLAASAAAVMAVASGALVAHADTTPTVYNTPGARSPKAASGTRRATSIPATSFGAVPRSGPPRSSTGEDDTSQ